jgi:2-oxoglutarate/2-oxoacid ferredoxin oxidoreductase subunit alpha
MPTKDLTIAMIGSGGDGVVTMGEMLAQAAARDGLNVIKTEAYGPQIRGGETSCVVRISADKIYAQGDAIDILAVFNWADFGRFKGEVVLHPNAAVLYEEADAGAPNPSDLGLGEGHSWVGVPFLKLATESTGTKAAKNIVSLGLFAELFGLPNESIRAAVEKKFTKKKAAVLEANLKGFDAGVAFAKGIPGDLSARRLVYTKASPKLLMSGNEASAVAALHAGCRFFGGYPITPSSEVLHFLSEWMPKVGGAVIQTEDELSALGACVGASFSGVKSMTSTSGPGLSLMTEMLGLASMAEIPTVVLDVQRGGPSTGLPTKSEQSDLWQAVFGGHGDQLRAVVAPTDVADCFHATVDAFNIAEEYQLPVIILSDQGIGQSRSTVDEEGLVHKVVDRAVPAADLGDKYLRYQDTESGVAPMSAPGMKGLMYQTNGLEHSESGSPSAMFLTHEKMNHKRYRKLRPIRDKYERFLHFGPEKANVGILCWGSSAGPVREAVAAANARGESVSAFVPQLIYPFPKHPFLKFLAGCDKLLVLEISFAAQFYKYIRTFMTLPDDRTILFKRSGGKNLTVGEVNDEIKKALAAKLPLEVKK